MMASVFLIACVVTLSNYFVDTPLARFVSTTLYRNRHWATYTSSIPDTLCAMVCVTTAVAFCCYVYRMKKGILNSATLFFLEVALAVPASYVLKSVMKVLFGRINTRTWLHKPESYGFHWFQGGSGYDGFPSGHMMVFITFIAVLWRFYPRYRSGYLFFTLLLGSALVATNYHFFSDVIAGAYLGIIVEIIACKALKRQTVEMA